MQIGKGVLWHNMQSVKVLTSLMEALVASMLILTLLNLDIYLAFANIVDPDQLASKKPTDLDLHCLSFKM